MTYFIVTYTYGEKSLIQDTRPAHRDFITGLKDNGDVIAAGPFAGDEQSVIIVRLPENATQADAQALLADDPYLAAGALADRDFREWNPVINVWD
ncbi:YciI family protein [Corynebacterium urinipleomorphum]|uniref:YciI family protein n=1 Tax=Corynebacterium urinipleomorphum TaxID=1852380 RepID=UPI000B34B63F|nr:YciI family protein [Corynebacterium urinipleomorphum]